jgi:hypothetical protein
MCSRSRMLVTVGALATTLSACGGAGGYGVASTPPPLVTPTPTPTATPTAANLPVSVSQTTEFQTVNSDVRISFDSAKNSYEVMLPGKDWAVLTAGTYDYTISDASGAKLGTASFSGSDKYRYTGLADVFANGSRSFAYGVATPFSGVPVIGSATYNAELRGSGGGYSIGGSAEFDFNFATGTLSGWLQPTGNDPGGWGPYALGGRRDFAQTVYSTGSATFSGSLSYNGAVGGSFSGLFTGPQAQELMGKFEFPFDDYYSPGKTITGTGVFVGKKGP